MRDSKEGAGTVPDRTEPGFSETELLGMWLRQTPDHALIFIALDGRITHWRGAAEKIFGYSAAEIEGQPTDILFTQEDRQRGLPAFELEEALKSPRAEDERWYVRHDGLQIWVSGSVAALRDERGEVVGFLKAARDRTNKRSYVQGLENRVSDLANSSAYKEVAVTTLAHELRNPLAPLVNAVHLIRLTPGSQHLAHPLQIIDRQIEALRRLVDDLADAGRVATGSLRLRLEQADLTALLQDLVDSMRPEFEARRLTLTLLVPLSPVVIEMDRARIHQAALNLMGNALRYTSPGGFVWLKATVEGAHAVVRVQDTGVGLSAETMPHIFNLFTRAPSAERMAPSGMGIGLALVKQIAELHQGAVSVSSEGLGKGSEFTLRLPLQHPEVGTVREGGGE